MVRAPKSLPPRGTCQKVLPRVLFCPNTRSVRHARTSNYLVNFKPMFQDIIGVLCAVVCCGRAVYPLCASKKSSSTDAAAPHINNATRRMVPPKGRRADARSAMNSGSWPSPTRAEKRETCGVAKKAPPRSLFEHLDHGERMYCATNNGKGNGTFFQKIFG